MKADYPTMVHALKDLKKEGYKSDFQVSGNAIVCSDSGKKLKPGECVVDKVYRFEGESNPSDSSIVYAISAPDQGIKGVLVSAYSTYSEPMEDDLVKLLSMDHHE
nr:phosphoribosylpyrophosphate synthetase [Saprospiraceae bacterium]